MLRKILVTLDSSDFTPVAIRFAAEMAQAGQKAKAGTAAVVGLAVVDPTSSPWAVLPPWCPANNC